MVKGLELLSCEERLEELGLLGLEKRRRVLSVNLNARRQNAKGTELDFVVPRDRTGGNGHKLKHWRFF